MSEVVTPQDLAPLKRPLIEAVINAYMLKNVTGTGGLTGDHGSCAEGEFRYKVPVDWDYDPKFYVSYPEGVWKEDRTWAGDPEVGDDEQVRDFDITTFDAKAVWAEIEEMVSSWIDPWIETGPNPNDFTNQITSIANVIQQLYVQDEVRVGGQDVSAAGEEPETGVSSPVSDIRDNITDIHSLLGDLGGSAIDALEIAYSNDIGLTISGQRALATVAGLAMAGEATAWNCTYADLKTFFENATADFNSYAQGSEGSGQGVRQTLSAVAGVATIGAGASVAVVPLAGALTAVAGVASLGAAFWPVEEARPVVQIALEGGSYDEYVTSFQQSVRKIDLELTYAEQDLAAMCSRAITDYNSNPDSYSITKKNLDGTPQPNEDLGVFLNAQIDISPTKMIGVGGRIEAIGDHQRSVAGVLGGSDGAGNPSAIVKNEWYRGSLVGATMGSGDYGPFDAFDQVVDTLIDLLLMEADTAHRIAEHCIAIAHDFKATDEDIEAQLMLEKALYDTVAIPVVNG